MNNDRCIWPNLTKPRICFTACVLGISILSGCKPEPTNAGFSSLLAQQGKEVTYPANLEFPRDHLPHPDYGIEWWYLTANLEDEQGIPVWLQWTLFRIKTGTSESKGRIGEKQNKSGGQGSANSWTDGQFYMAHFSMHTAQKHVYRELFATGGVGNVGVYDRKIHINDWQLSKSEQGLPSGLTLSYVDNDTGTEVSVDLDLDTRDNYLLQGDGGYSLKHPETSLASYYYSLPNISVVGRVSFGDKTNNARKMHHIKGQAWYDHEWSSMFLSEHFSGWSWFSIHLDDGSKVTLFTLEPNPHLLTQPYKEAWYAAIMYPDGTVTRLSDDQINVVETQWQDTVIGTIPTNWHITLRDFFPDKHTSDFQNLDLDIEVNKHRQISPFTIPYYEGAITVTGNKSGTGFVEMTR